MGLREGVYNDGALPLPSRYDPSAVQANKG